MADQARGSGANAWGWWLGAAAAAAVVAYRVRRRWPRFDLHRKVALVTGGSRGLGFAVARELLRHGARVALCARDGDDVRAAARALGAQGWVLGRACDVTDAGEVAALLGDVAAEFGEVDVVVNNAGTMTVGPLEHMTREDFAEAMDVHYGGVLNVILGVLPSMRRRRQGRIVNIASIGGLVPIPHMAPYVASKFALVGLSRALREELAGDGIAVTTVCPGPMRTGSPFGARFKGQSRGEFAWFTATDALPIVSTGAHRAARRVVQAVRSGEPEVVIGGPAKLLRLLDGIAPGLTGDVIGRFRRAWLPGPGGRGAASESGAHSTGRLEGTWLLRRVERAADELQRHDPSAPEPRTEASS